MTVVPYRAMHRKRVRMGASDQSIDAVARLSNTRMTQLPFTPANGASKFLSSRKRLTQYTEIQRAFVSKPPVHTSEPRFSPACNKGRKAPVEYKRTITAKDFSANPGSFAIPGPTA